MKTNKITEVEWVNLAQYNGCCYDDFEIIKETALKQRSYYCHNYLKGFDDDILYAWSDDDNLTEYYICLGDKKIPFAESFTSQGDIIEVYSEFLR